MFLSSIWQKVGTALYWLTWPGTWLLIRRTQRTRLLLMVGDEILVTKTWLGDGRWSLTGGGLHTREAPLDGVIRETSEEIGLQLLPAIVKPLMKEVFRDRGLSYVSHYFIARLPAKPEIQLQRAEITASRWVRLRDVNVREYSPSVQLAARAAKLS